MLHFFWIMSHRKMVEAIDYDGMNLPKLIAFDLDGTIWTPDMYQLWGGGAPFTYVNSNNQLLDKNGNTVRLLGESARILHILKNVPALQSIIVSWVSCTDEPVWAAECLQKFKTVPGGKPIATAADASQIFIANKQNHFRNLKKDYPNIEYAEMLFFDNEQGNIVNVSKLGVKCVLCESGMTADIWRKGLKMFN